MCIKYCENFAESGYQKIGQSIITSNTNQNQSHDNDDNGYYGEVIDQNQSHNNEYGEVIGKIIKIILFLIILKLELILD